MKMWKTIAVLALAVGIGLPVFQAGAQDVDYGPMFDYPPVKGQSSFTFLKIGTSPRVVAMGEAFTAMPGSIDGILSNPAGLGFMKGGQYSLGYTPTNAARDGSFRKVQVKATRRGLRVQARKGYYAPTGG